MGSVCLSTLSRKVDNTACSYRVYKSSIPWGHLDFVGDSVFAYAVFECLLVDALIFLAPATRIVSFPRSGS